MNGWLQASAGGAQAIKEIAFLKMMFPVFLVGGIGIFGYFGYKGLVERQTLVFGSRMMPGGTRGGVVTGTTARVVGAFYLLFGVPLMAWVLGPFSYYLWAS